jgi:Carboxypeptidase regulatory-like domain
MKRNWLRVMMLLPLITVINLLSYGQVTTTSRISGTVMDTTGGVLQSVDVVIKNEGSGDEFRVKTSSDGTFIVPSLSVGTYTVTVSAPGFKQTIIKDVRTEIGNTVTVEVKLEVGATSESVVITGGAEVLQTENTNVGAVITGRQITELPFTSRDALDLVLSLPGTSTVGRPRSSSVNGLPKGALAISMDGINVQDNTLRSTDGFFTYIRPRIDAIEEVSVSTATPGAEASAGGAVHIRFVTKSGTNEFHGGAWWYHRQRALNSNYYFSNLTNTERAQVRLNQWGFKIGGPITPWLKDRAFFFFDYDEFRLPEQQTRTRTILTPDAQAGIFRYPGGPAASTCWRWRQAALRLRFVRPRPIRLSAKFWPTFVVRLPRARSAHRRIRTSNHSRSPTAAGRYAGSRPRGSISTSPTIIRSRRFITFRISPRRLTSSMAATQRSRSLSRS